MQICIIGHTGFVGQTVYEYLSNKHDVFGINSQTKDIPNQKFDVIINCAGSSKKYVAQKTPSEDFLMNANVFSTILKLKFKKLIHISSISVSDDTNSNYAKSKAAAENWVKLYYPQSTILRLSGLVGPNLEKNVVFDIQNNRKLFVTLDSIYNFISTNEVAKIIEKVIELDINKKTINVSAASYISVKDIIKDAKIHSIHFDNTEGDIKEDYSRTNIGELSKFFWVKGSKFYVTNYLQYLLKTKHIPG